MTFFEKKYFPFLFLFIVAFISRIPFLAAGFGIEEDSWGIALAAFHTNMSGIYEPSRLPGHPVQELIYSALWGTGPLVFNGLSALFGAIGTLVFAAILKQLHFKHFFIAALAFSFIPVYYISSTYTIDFVWTETFVLISFYFLLKEKLITCGIFLGLAVGCRITSGAMLLPFLVIGWHQGNFKQNIILLLKMAVPMIVIVTLAFLPILKQYGTSFFMYYDQFPYPPVSKVFYKMIIGVFGFIGILGIGIAVPVSIINSKQKKSVTLFQNGLTERMRMAAYMVIVLYTISYFRLPQKSGYMLPVIPFVILLFGYYLDSRYFRLLCIAFVLSPFLCSINLTDKLRGSEYSKYAVTFRVSGQELFFDIFSGPVFSDYSKRKQKIKYTQQVIEKGNLLRTKTVIIAGWWYNEIMVTTIPLEKNKNVIYEGYIDRKMINKYLAEGYSIFYLPEQNIYNDQMYKMKYTDSVSKQFLLF